MQPRLMLFASLICASLLFGPSGSVAASPAGGKGVSSAHAIDAADYVPDAEECAFVSLINQFRVDNGKKPLVLLRSLGAAAADKSADMAKRNYFSHTAPPTDDGEPSVSFSENITNHGYGGSGRGENIAAGYGEAQATFNQWERSTPHRRNMLGQDIAFKAMGIARAYDPDSEYGWYWTTTFGDEVSGESVTCASTPDTTK